jgi:hypothetical protein
LPVQNLPTRAAADGTLPGEHGVPYHMLLESMESFVGQLVLHKHHCDGELVEGSLVAPRFNYYCALCKMNWEIHSYKFHDSAWRYIRGAHRESFQSFIKSDLSKFSGQYENLFVAYQVMQS